MDYNAARIYVSVVEQGSFSGAAKVLNTPVSTVSRKVSELEAQLELRLLERSTRQLRLTEAGQVFYEHAQRSIVEAEAGILALDSQQQNLKGTLRLSIMHNFESMWPILKSFQEQYPKVNIEVRDHHGFIDFVADGVDVAIVTVPIQNPNYVVREIAVADRVLVATKEYLSHHGTPTHPDELVDHSCLSIGSVNQDVTWTFDGKSYPIRPKLKASNIRMVKYFALQGIGIANIPPALCKTELESGQLIELFKPEDGRGITFKLVYPSRRLLSSITRTFIDHFLAEIENKEGKDWFRSVDMP
ncbi:LysR family transcriptional regulator [Vibrio superstes]|uniref:Transcriptional regulator n=1 Tax=Vibrio superstes NBRC 103154 TaxID=1219062 RepID=A0A511QQ34_9VIBR|nr:LysR family transcriptional regulator [Vibrio superstes]GEM79016.1 transcriptional regulator [Vibrio superstes NBRC 103154]